MRAGGGDYIAGDEDGFEDVAVRIQPQHDGIQGLGLDGLAELIVGGSCGVNRVVREVLPFDRWCCRWDPSANRRNSAASRCPAGGPSPEVACLLSDGRRSMFGPEDLAF
jgi:hypothetical protein